MGEIQTNQTIPELYAAHGPRLYRYAVLLLADGSAAEDALQDTFVQLARVLRRKPGAQVSFGYLATALRHTCYSMLRRRRAGPFGPGVEPLIEPASLEASEEERMLIDDALKPRWS